MLWRLKIIQMKRCVYILSLLLSTLDQGCIKLISLKSSDIYAIRASGLIPVIPLTTINKDTQLPMCIEEQAINYWWSGCVHYSYLYQPDKIHNVLYYTKYEQGFLRPSPATRGGRATGIISEIWSYRRYDIISLRAGCWKKFKIFWKASKVKRKKGRTKRKRGKKKIIKEGDMVSQKVELRAKKTIDK